MSRAAPPLIQPNAYSASSNAHLDPDPGSIDRGIIVVPEPGRVPGKRAFDVIAGTILAVTTIPMQLIALAVSAIAFRAWPIFSQERVGKGGQTFVIRKVRSLPSETPNAASKYDVDFRQNNRAGQLLRKTHLDETIQFWAVITGELSLVGPRPEMVTLAANYDPSFLAVRTSVTPGITGLWQISDASEMLIAENPQYDLAYTTNRSWSLEIWIMFRTALKMAVGRTVCLDDLKKVETIGLVRRLRSSPAA